MSVLVDTNVWSVVLRRKKQLDSEVTSTLRNLITLNQAILIGPIRQELLTGFKEIHQFEQLQRQLRNFDNYPITVSDYEKAARYHTVCRQNGIQGSTVDLLLCAVADNNQLEIFTLDKDFELYQQHIPIKLYPYKTA